MTTERYYPPKDVPMIPLPDQETVDKVADSGLPYSEVERLTYRFIDRQTWWPPKGSSSIGLDDWHRYHQIRFGCPTWNGQCNCMIDP